MNNISCDVIYKDVKDITVKVKPNLNVELVVPHDTTDEYIQNILDKRKKWIQNHIDQFIKSKQADRNYISGEDFLYLGRRYRLKVIANIENKTVLKHGYLHLYCKDINDKKLKESIVESFYKTKAEEHFKKIISKYSHLYTDDVVFRIRKMKTRWGSCNPAKKYINLNQELIKKPKKAIEYVVLHEIAHLKHYNHDREFYNYLSAYMPDWKNVKYKLDFM